jgi:hypothetical protein
MDIELFKSQVYHCYNAQLYEGLITKKPYTYENIIQSAKNIIDIVTIHNVILLKYQMHSGVKKVISEICRILVLDYDFFPTHISIFTEKEHLKKTRNRILPCFKTSVKDISEFKTLADSFDTTIVIFHKIDIGKHIDIIWNTKNFLSKNKVIITGYDVGSKSPTSSAFDIASGIKEYELPVSPEYKSIADFNIKRTLNAALLSQNIHQPNNHRQNSKSSPSLNSFLHSYLPGGQNGEGKLDKDVEYMKIQVSMWMNSIAYRYNKTETKIHILRCNPHIIANILSSKDLIEKGLGINAISYINKDTIPHAVSLLKPETNILLTLTSKKPFISQIPLEYKSFIGDIYDTSMKSPSPIYCIIGYQNH